MKPLFLIPLLFAIRLAAIELPEFQDGQDVGNGGDVLVCPKGTAMPGTFLLDYYEGETRYGFHLIQEESEAPTVIAQHLVERMSVDPIRRKMYLDQLGTFMNEALFIPNTTLIDVPDSEHIALPKGCAVEQVAIQLIPQFPEEKRYTVSKDLWDDMTPSHRAGLMVHEILYREVLESHKNSIRVRYFNSLLAAKEFGDPTVFEYSLLLQRIRFPVGYLNFQGYLLSSITYENGQVRAGYFFYPSELAKPFVIQGKTLSFSGSGMVWFHPSGKIAQLTGSLTAPVELELVTGSRQLVGMPLFVDENQKVSGGIAGRSFSVLQYENCELEIQTGNQFRLFDTGR
ncbi:MAG: hypothetical protein HYR96_07915, partial [Deltaproteobacteria bacterium]|nr:hypothetical protein [Deltaproteobacteria bacterium]